MGAALDRARDNATVVTALLLVGLFIVLNVIGQSTLANVALFVGFPVVVPLVYLLYGDRAETAERAPQTEPAPEEERSDDAITTDDEIERLREQYARGRITEVEFEERIEEHLDPDVEDEAVPADGAAIDAELERIRNE